MEQTSPTSTVPTTLRFRLARVLDVLRALLVPVEIAGRVVVDAAGVVDVVPVRAGEAPAEAHPRVAAIANGTPVESRKRVALRRGPFLCLDAYGRRR